MTGPGFGAGALFWDDVSLPAAHMASQSCSGGCVVLCVELRSLNARRVMRGARSGSVGGTTSAARTSLIGAIVQLRSLSA